MRGRGVRKGAGDVAAGAENGRQEEGDVVIDPKEFLKIEENVWTTF